jgi:predicted amidohydrolase
MIIKKEPRAMSMKVASVQYWFKDENTKEERLDHLAQLIDQAGDADLMILPETWNVGFLCFDLYQKESEPLDGPTISMVAEKARKHNAYILAGTIIEQNGSDFHNTAVFLNPKGEIIATYRKLHLVTRAGAAEAKVCKPGKGPVTVKTDFGVVGFGVCYDLRFPELYRQMTIHDGMEIILQPSAWPLQRVENWVDLMHARAAENQCYLISCNIAGVNRGVQNFGHSAIVDYNGLSIASGGLTQCIVKGEIDVEALRNFRQETPHLQNRVLQV